MPSSHELARREQAIEVAQRRLRWLEIETRRMKAELARLSADCDDDVAEALSREWGRPESIRDDESRDVVAVGIAQCAVRLRGEESPRNISTVGQEASPFTFDHDIASTGFGEPGIADPDTLEADEPLREWTAAPLAVPELLTGEATGVGSPNRSATWWRRAKVTPLACSCTLHTAIVVFLAFGVSYTVAKLEDHSLTLLTSLSETVSDASLPAPLGDEDLEPASFSGGDVATALVPDDRVTLAGDIVPTMDLGESTAAPIAATDVGRLDRLPSDLGTLLADTEANAGGIPGNGDASAGTRSGGGSGNGSGGKRGGGSSTGSRNATMFFGTHAKGNRFVFVIDNSSSMKDGRLDIARAELLRTVQSFAPKQSFYVIFVSDQTYPMFYPQRESALLPATPANVKRLADWLPNAILASGKNRELIKAMDAAAALQPDAVYLLWDGDMKYSDTVRLDVMTHLTAPNQWNFAVHTLGMGATSAEAEQNLAAIAQAHGGVYRRVDVPGMKARK